MSRSHYQAEVEAERAIQSRQDIRASVEKEIAAWMLSMSGAVRLWSIEDNKTRRNLADAIASGKYRREG